MNITALPDWMTFDADAGRMTVDADGAYAAWVQLLGIESLTKAHLERIHACIKLDVQLHAAVLGLDPRPEKTLVIRITGGEGFKDRWSVAACDADGGYSAFPDARSRDRALALEGKDLFRKVRGALPV